MRPAWKKSRRSRPPVSRFLACEPLENRCLLTIAAFTVNLYEDTGAGPGDLISDDVVQSGQRFYVEVLAREYDPLAAGLRAIALDIAWDPAVFQEIDADFDPSDPTSPLVTADFPLFRTGELDNHAGTIDNLAGAAFLSSGDGRAIGNARAERFSLLHFQALQPAEESAFSIRQGLSSIVTVPVFGLGDTDLYFEQTTITVTPGSTLTESESSIDELPMNDPSGSGAATSDLSTSDFFTSDSSASDSSTSELSSSAPISDDSASTGSLPDEQLISSPAESFTLFVGPLTAEDFFQSKLTSFDTAAHGEGLNAPATNIHDCWSSEPIESQLAVSQNSYRPVGAWSGPKPVLPGFSSNSDWVVDEAQLKSRSVTSNSQPAADAIDAMFGAIEPLNLLDDVEGSLQQLVDDPNLLL